MIICKLVQLPNGTMIQGSVQDELREEETAIGFENRMIEILDKVFDSERIRDES